MYTGHPELFTNEVQVITLSGWCGSAGHHWFLLAGVPGPLLTHMALLCELEKATLAICQKFSVITLCTKIYNDHACG